MEAFGTHNLFSAQNPNLHVLVLLRDQSSLKRSPSAPPLDDTNVGMFSCRDRTQTVFRTSSVPAQKQADLHTHVHTLGVVNL